MKKNNTYKSLAMTMYTIAAIILAVGFATVVFASAEEQGNPSSDISTSKPVEETVAVDEIAPETPETADTEESTSSADEEPVVEYFCEDDDDISDEEATETPDETEPESEPKVAVTGQPGRLVIPDLGINVAMVWGLEQSIVDAPDSAATWSTGAGITIADHWNQGNYTNIQYSVPGSTIAYVDNTAYVCVSCFERHNTGYTVTDESGNDVMNTLGAGQVLLYTCNGCWQNVHVAIYSVM